MIDDNPDLAHLVGDMLALDGAIVVVLQTQAERENYRNLDWDTTEGVLTDLRMPPPDGEEILAWLKANHPNVRRVIMTAALEVTSAEAALAHSMVVKPFGIQQVEEALRG